MKHSPRPAIFDSGNVGTSERWLSAAAGLSLALQALRGRGLVSRLLLASAGLSLLARGATGYCGVKSTLSGETSLRQGMREQGRRLRQTLGGETLESLDTLDALYAVELQELHSAETQLIRALGDMVATVQDAGLSLRLEEYATELRSRHVDLESLLARREIDPRPHPDDVLHGLLNETEKMARVCAPTLRDAAIVASLQRIIHYKIAGYGTIAAYAKSLGRTEEAAHFSELASRDKAVDAELTRLAKGTLNPDAARTTPEYPTVPGSMRTH